MLASVKAHEAAVAGVAWRDGDGGLATVALDGAVRLWRHDSEAEAKVEAHNRAVAAAKTKEEKAEVEKAKAPPPILSAVKRLEGAHAGGAVAVTASLDGSTVVSSGVHGDMTVWDAATWRPRARLADATPSESWRLAAAPAAPLFAAGGLGGVVGLYGLADGVKVGEVATGADFISGLSWSLDGSRLAAAGMDGSLTVVDVASATVRTRIDAHLLPARAVAFSHDGQLLYSASDDRRVGIWDVSAGAPAAPLVRALTGHVHWVTAVSAAPDKHVAATGSADGTVRVWDVRAGAALSTFDTHTGKVWGVAWNPAGNRLASVSDAGALALHAVAVAGS